MSSGSRPSQPSWVTPSQMQEVLAFNASLTPAGQRSRPGRSRGPSSGLNRGRDGYAPGRTTTSSFGAGSAGTARAGSGARNAPMTNWTVGPTTAQPVFKPASPVRTRSRSPTRVASTPSTFGHYATGPPNPPKIRETVLVANGTVPIPQQASMNVPPPAPGGRQLITSNMTPDDPTKPWIPAHLQQKSAFDTIRHLSHITGYGIEELTSDGVSIPGVLKPRSVSLNLPNQAPASTPNPIIPTSTAPANTQAEVDPNAWMSAYANRGRAVAEPTRVVSYSDMDVDMDGSSVPPTVEQPRTLQVGTLADSQWANPSTAVEPPPTAVSAQAWNNLSNDSNVPPTIKQPRTFQVGTLADSQWATPAVNPAQTIVSVQSWNNFSSNNNNPLSAANAHQNTMSRQSWNNLGNNTMERPAIPATLRNVGPTDAAAANLSDALARALAEAKPEKKLATLKDSRWA